MLSLLLYIAAQLVFNCNNYLYYMFSDNTTICVTHDQFVTGGTDSNLYITEEATSMPPNVVTATVMKHYCAKPSAQLPTYMYM